MKELAEREFTVPFINKIYRPQIFLPEHISNYLFYYSMQSSHLFTCARLTTSPAWNKKHTRHNFRFIDPRIKCISGATIERIPIPTAMTFFPCHVEIHFAMEKFFWTKTNREEMKILDLKIFIRKSQSVNDIKCQPFVSAWNNKNIMKSFIICIKNNTKYG